MNDEDNTTRSFQRLIVIEDIMSLKKLHTDGPRLKRKQEMVGELNLEDNTLKDDFPNMHIVSYQK